jgi:XamI restriction endonuclease
VIPPPRWSSEQLDHERAIAIERFREERMREPLERYLDLFDERRGQVEILLETLIDIDLEQIDDDTVTGALTNPALLEAFRYLPGPPISRDDLKELAQTSLSVKALKNPTNARAVVRTVLAGLDRRRFPWVSEEREPTEAERTTSIVASAALIASQRRATERRNEGKALQEASVFAALESVGFTRVATRHIHTLAEAPGPGEFCSESLLGTRKADVVVRLWDTRVLAIECKVSNSATNSIKRLNNDAAVKAGVWLDQFGTEQLIPAATLTGVFKLGNLVSAQERHLTLFWAHDLATMTDWIARTRV